MGFLGNFGKMGDDQLLEQWDFEFRLHAQNSESTVNLNHHKYVTLSELKAMFERFM